jgi:hypothetical protein
LTLEPDVAQQVRRTMAEKKLPMKRVVNDALRAGLVALRKRKNPPQFTVKPFPGGFRPGIDQTKLGQLADQLEDEYYLSKLREEGDARS